MLLTRHRFAEIEYLTESDIELSELISVSANRYLSSDPRIDILQSFHQVHSDEFTLAPLSASEIIQVQKFERLDHLGVGGLQILPLVVIDGREDRYSPYFVEKEKPFNFPILRVKSLRARLFS